MAELGFIKEFLGFDSCKLYATSQRLTNSLPVTTGLNARWEPIYRIKLDNISTNELFVITGSVEFTNNLNHPASCVWRFVVNSNYDDQPGQNGAFTIGAGGGDNVHKNVQHHHLLDRTTFWCSSQFYGGRNITLMGRCVSSDAQPGSTIDLTSADGELKIIRMKFIS